MNETTLERDSLREIEKAAISPARTFALSDYEVKKALEWIIAHRDTCPLKDRECQGYRGGEISYIFTPLFIGVNAKVQCKCGASEDVTDYDSW